MVRLLVSGLAGSLLLGLAACAPLEPAPASQEPNQVPMVTTTPKVMVTPELSSATETPTAARPVPTLAIPLDTHGQALTASAQRDLVQRYSANAADVHLIAFESVTWPNASLGCPQPGMMYADVLTPGYLIVLEYDSRQFEYHAGTAGDPVWCKDPSPPVPGMPGNT